jgi:hypothetical protein
VDMSSLTYKMNLPIELVLPEGFPCPKCIVYANCSRPCDKLLVDHNKLTYLITDMRICPDCGKEAIRSILFLNSATLINKCKRCTHIFTRFWDDDGNSNWVRDLGKRL